MRKSFWILFASIIAVFIAVNIFAKKQENVNAPIEQYIESAKITVTAPPLERQEALEQKTKDILKDRLKTAYYFSSSYKKADYMVHYCEYKNEVKLQAGIDSIVLRLKDNNLVYEVKENAAGSLEGLLLEGVFEKDGKKFGIKSLLIKDKTAFWQIMSIYPYSDKNNKTAESFIKSVEVTSNTQK
ncbi:MAG: hypothetical protein FWG57_07115 [Endomicrobia bacterium]|nr:hypothetical protein [Endomicrobiia bacterium]